MRILVVEDEERLATSIIKGLEAHGFAADYVTEGEAALKRILLYHNEYDVIILDLMLPGKSGEEICNEMRENEITTPVLVLTARNEVDNKVNLLNSGADDYLTKPFDLSELIARVNALLRRPKESQPVVLEVGDITLDTGSRTVTQNGTPVSVTLKEFALLEYLMRHHGQVLNREELLNHLWDFNFTGFSNIVDVHVKNLRKKLGDTRGKRIATVRGVGYQLKE